MEDDISSKVLKFANDTKVFRKVTDDTDKQSLQDDIDKLPVYYIYTIYIYMSGSGAQAYVVTAAQNLNPN